jgi:hypothetical protein
MIAAAYFESTLGANQRNKQSGAGGLFQLLSSPFMARAKSLGGIYNSWANTCAILANYVAYWRVHRRAAPGVCASFVEQSNYPASRYAAPLSWLPASFKRLTLKPCPRLKPVCAPYFGGTQYAYPNCSQDGSF